jgi:putative iron-regulated protein
MITIFICKCIAFANENDYCLRCDYIYMGKCIVKLLLMAAVIVASTALGGCKLVVKVPEGGSVTSASGNYDCAEGKKCIVDVADTSFDETFKAVPALGYVFDGWKKRKKNGFCGGQTGPCRLSTSGFGPFEALMDILASDNRYVMEPKFVPFDGDGVTALLETNADIALAAYSDSVDTARALRRAIRDFSAEPTGAALYAVKRAWLVSREPYGQTEVYRFRLSPIDSTNYADEDGVEGDINAWPLGEALIDYVIAAGPDFGSDQIGVTENGVGINGGGEVDGGDNMLNIIADTSITINNALISNTVTAGDEHDVIAGYHAIEFMLWGQDLNDNAMVTNGNDREQAVKTNGAGNVAAGGQRPLTDFTSDPLAPRRFKYLEVVVNKLVRDLKSVRDGWLDGVDGNYRDQFTSFADRDEAVEKLTEILTGMGTLSEGELAGERMQISYSSNSQEDEHSCFSDNTHRDVVLNARGIWNSFYGSYSGYDSDLDGLDDKTNRAVNGFGFDDYAEQLGIDSLRDITDQLAVRLALTDENVNEVDESARNGMPFDVLIMDENRSPDNPVYKAIISLNQQSSSIAALAQKLAIEVQVVDEDASECDTSDPDAGC